VKRISVRRSSGALLTIGLLGAGAFAFAGPAAAEQERLGATAAEITAEFQNGKMSFEGPKTVPAGSDLRIVNNTDPQQIGPHTISFTKKRLIPNTRAEMRACGRGQLRICRKIIKAHKANPETGQVGRVVVERGKEGWNQLFSRKRQGDSWFTETQNEEHTRRVSAVAGKVLPFFCVVHPDMQGKIKVVPAPIE